MLNLPNLPNDCKDSKAHPIPHQGQKCPPSNTLLSIMQRERRLHGVVVATSNQSNLYRPTHMNSGPLDDALQSSYVRIATCLQTLLKDF